MSDSNDNNPSRNNQSLIRLEERMVAEKSARNTRDEQFLRKINNLEEEDDALCQEMDELEEKIENISKSSEEMRNRTEGQLALIKALVPIIGVILSVIIGMGVYILHDSRIQAEKELRKDIDKLEKTMYKGNNHQKEGKK